MIPQTTVWGDGNAPKDLAPAQSDPSSQDCCTLSTLNDEDEPITESPIPGGLTLGLSLSTFMVLFNLFNLLKWGVSLVRF